MGSRIGRRVAPLGLAALGALWAIARSFRPFRVAVAGPSMAPTLRPEDYVLAVRPGRIRRGDIVVVRVPGREFEMVKRVVGLPGERVRVDGRVVVVDGRRLAEPYARGAGASGAWTLGSGEYLVLGDDRTRSTDGRAFGPLARDAILGVVLFRYWPKPLVLRRGR